MVVTSYDAKILFDKGLADAKINASGQQRGGQFDRLPPSPETRGDQTMATKFATTAAEAAHKKDLAARRAARSAAIKAETPVQKAMRLAKRRRRNLHKAFAQLGHVGRYSLPIKAREQLVGEIVSWADECCKAILRQSGGKDGLPELASE